MCRITSETFKGQKSEFTSQTCVFLRVRSMSSAALNLRNQQTHERAEAAHREVLCL